MRETASQLMVSAGRQAVGATVKSKGDDCSRRWHWPRLNGGCRKFQPRHDGHCRSLLNCYGMAQHSNRNPGW